LGIIIGRARRSVRYQNFTDAAANAVEVFRGRLNTCLPPSNCPFNLISKEFQPTISSMLDAYKK
jgi:hypothetical protein